MAKPGTLRRAGGPHFGFAPGRLVENRYVLGEFIGAGYEGEVYHLTETRTGIERVVKFFYPDRYRDSMRGVRLARKFHRLRRCTVVLQYHHYGEISLRRKKIGYMVSELAAGQVLHDLTQAQPRKRFAPFEALHLILAIARGVSEIHDLGGYHGDIHEDNILVERRGVSFRIKLIDLFLHPRDTPDRRRLDVADLAHLLYMLVGGPAGYPGSPRLVKQIVCGRRRQTLYRKFPHAGALVDYLETFEWHEGAN
jgi:tRNA A-37 threonylcarbamoyl transferase component Bud32